MKRYLRTRKEKAIAQSLKQTDTEIWYRLGNAFFCAFNGKITSAIEKEFFSGEVNLKSANEIRNMEWHQIVSPLISRR